MNAVRLGFVVMAALAAAQMQAAPAPHFRPDRNPDRAALTLLKHDLAVQGKELVEFWQEEEFWIVTVLDHRERPSKRWIYVISQRQAPTRIAAFNAIRSRFIVVDSESSGVEPD
jgi:hypothetical protein